MDINNDFCRGVLKEIHAEVRAAFPEIPNVARAASALRQIGRDQWFVQIQTPGRPMFNYDCRAYNAADAKSKAWRAFMDQFRGGQDATS